MSYKKKDILILGIGQSNFLNQLYGGISKKTDQFQFSVDGYFDLSKGINKTTSKPYLNYFNFKQNKISRAAKFRSFLKFATTILFYEVLFFELSQRTSFRYIRNQLRSLAEEKYRVEKFILPLNFENYHFHFCIAKNLMPIYFLPKTAKVICTFWGSDLMRETGVKNVFYVKKALLAASQITLQTPEMAEILFCKYGRELTLKTTALRFTIDEEIFDTIDTLRGDENAISEFKKEYNIPENKTVIALGHNAFKENNHLKMIAELAKLPAAILEHCIFLLHLSYGNNPAYMEELVKTTEAHKNLSFCVIYEFMGPAKIALLRLSTDVLIQMPISDALSGAMTEVLYAGNHTVAASWLPYGFFRRSNIHYYEAETFNQLPLILSQLLQEKDLFRSRNNGNREAIRKHFFPESTTPEWIKLFNEVYISK